MLLLSPVSFQLNVLCWGLLLPLLLWSISTAPWRSLVADPNRYRLLSGALVALGLIWAFLGIPIDTSFRAHPLLVTCLTLVFGFRFALLAGLLATLLAQYLAFNAIHPTYPTDVLLWQHPSVKNTAFNTLSNIALPAALTVLAAYGVRKVAIQNIFVYILGVGFICAMVISLICHSVGLAVLNGFEPHIGQSVADHFSLFLLLTFPEGFSNGALISSLAVLAPNMVKTYDDNFYLKEPKSPSHKS